MAEGAALTPEKCSELAIALTEAISAILAKLS
jgi:hypothetical protein